MTREHVLIALGVLVLISPWSGIPMHWLQWALLLIGIAVAGIAISLRRRAELPPAAEPPAHAPHLREPEPRSSHIAFS